MRDTTPFFVPQSGRWGLTASAFTLVLVWTSLLVLPAAAAESSATEATARGIDVAEVISDAQVGPPVTPFRIDIDLRDLAEDVAWKPGDPIRDIPLRFYWDTPPPFGPAEPQVDALMPHQRDAAALGGSAVDPEFTAPVVNVAGQGFTGVNPPDTVGDVGPNHFIQMINSGQGARVRILDKTGVTVVPDFLLDTLGTGTCADGFGDPIALWDRPAQRWVLTEFARGANALCVYVSQTPDPVAGGWYAYQFNTPTFPDYPKYAVWPTDANGGDGSYIVTANDGGPGAYALERGPMLEGNSSRLIRLGMPPLSGFAIQGPSPVDPDGPGEPPVGAPALIMRHRDTEAHGGSADGDLLEVWSFQVNWDTASATLSQALVDVADFDSNLCGLVGLNCFQQPTSTTTLMPLREVLHNRVQYINHGEYESIFGNLVTDVNGADLGGVRWFELRRSGGAASPWTLYQEGTYSIDDNNRWMGAGAMDQSGNIALAYNIVSATVQPSLRYTGRLAGDPLGLMTQPETTIHPGTASNSSNRYGDYASMGLDPVDDCTFWFTGMDNTSNVWRTQIAAFRFRDCGCLVQPTAPVVAAAAEVADRADLSWGDADLSTVTEYRVQRSLFPDGPFETVAVVADSSPGVAGGPGYGFEDVDLSGGATYYYAVIATDGGPCASETVDNTVAVETFGTCTLDPAFGGLTAVGSAGQTTCGIALDWNAATGFCGGPVTYNVYRGSQPGVVPGPATLLVSGVSETQLVDVNAVGEGETFHYVVQAVDQANGRVDTNLVELSGRALGPNAGNFAIIDEDFEDPASFADWTVSTVGNHRCGEWERSNFTAARPSGGSGDFALARSELTQGSPCDILLPITNTLLDSPVVDLSDPGLESAVLDARLFFDRVGDEEATVEAFDGNAWQVIWTAPAGDFDNAIQIDVTGLASGNSQFQLRFSYLGANDARWFAVDDVRLTVVINNPCDPSASPAVLPGSLGGDQPLLADRSAGSTDFSVSWDAQTCSLGTVQLLYGDLSNVSTLQLDGSLCDLGGSGSFDWVAPPSGNLFFLLTDRVDSIEGSWGASSLGERNGLAPSGECGVTFKSVTGGCP